METGNHSLQDMGKVICEIWKPINGYVGMYEISNMGNVKSVDRIGFQRNKFDRLSKYMFKGRHLKIQTQKNGYQTIDLSKNGKHERFLIHRLVAEHFLEHADGKDYINHIDSNPRNNHVDNLEWCTQSKNIKYSYEQGRKIPPHQRKTGQFDIDGNLIKIWKSQTEAQRVLGIPQANIFKVCSGQRKSAGGYKWQYIE